MTMYLNDVQRTSFYEGIGLNTRDFDMHVIVEVMTSQVYQFDLIYFVFRGWKPFVSSCFQDPANVFSFAKILAERDESLIILGFIVQTNRTTARIFPAVLDVENPVFQERLDKLVILNQRLIDIGKTDAPPALKAIQRVPTIFAFVGEILALYLMKPVDSGSLDFVEPEAQMVY